MIILYSREVIIILILYLIYYTFKIRELLIYKKKNIKEY
jgi:hypothetical protein